MVAEYPGNAAPTIPIPTAGPGVYLNAPSLTGVLTDIRDELAAGLATLGANPQATYATVAARLAAMQAAITSAGSGGTTINLTVPSDGSTDAAPDIQAVLDALHSSAKPYHVRVVGTTKNSPILLNSKVRITTNNTKVTFAGPVLIGASIDPDGFGGLSILGTADAPTTVTSGATRGSSKVVVASTTGIQVKKLIRIYDNDVSGGADVGHKSEMAEVVDIVGSTVYVDHPLHHTYTGTVNLAVVNAVTGSGFEGVNATFVGQQAAAFRFVAKMQYARHCFFRDMRFRGDPANSWSREAVNVRWSYRSLVQGCETSFGWNYATGSTYDYGFSSDGSTGTIYDSCFVSNTRHGFSADKGSAGLIYTACIVDNATASAFDLHGGWTRDILYAGCSATASDTRNATDTTKTGYLAGNTTFTNGSHNITYVGCVARGYRSYTASGGSAGEGTGFGVVDGSTQITMMACRIVDSQFGVKVLSQIGQPIVNVSILGCEFNGIGSGSATSLPIWVTAGIAPQDVDGLVIRGNAFINCASMSAARIYGNSGNTLANIVIEGNTWHGPGSTGVYALDVRYVADLVVRGNTFYKSRRVLQLTGCVDAAVVDNLLYKIADGADASKLILDSGGNTNLLFVRNLIVGFVPTSWGSPISSSGAQVMVMPAQPSYSTAGRPSAAVVGRGADYFDSTTGKPAWSTGAAWVNADGTAA